MLIAGGIWCDWAMGASLTQTFNRLPFETAQPFEAAQALVPPPKAMDSEPSPSQGFFKAGQIKLLAKKAAASQSPVAASPRPLYPFLGRAKPDSPKTERPRIGLYGFKSPAGSDWAVTPAFEAANPFGPEGLAWVSLDRAYGIIDSVGHFVLPPKPNLAGISGFSFDLAPASNSEHLWGFVNRQGDFEIEPTFMETGPFAANNLAPAADSNWLWGYVDRTGQWAIEPAYESAKTFSADGVARVTLQNHRIGLIDYTGAWLIEPELIYLSPYDGFELARAETIHGTMGLIDRQGRWVAEPKFKRVEEFSAIGLAVATTPEGLMGAIDTQGRWVIKPAFSHLGSFGEHGLAAAAQGQLYGLVDSSGRWVVSPAFSEVLDLTPDGLARARDKDGRLGFIDVSGRWVVPPICQWALGFGEDGLALAREDWLWGYINLEGQWAVKAQFSDLGRFAENGLAPAKHISGRWGYIDRTGQWAIEPKFLQASEFAGQAARALNDDGDWGLINSSGQWVLQPRYMRINDFNQNGVAIVVSSRTLNAGLLGRNLKFIVSPQFRFCEDDRTDGLIRCQYGFDTRDTFYLTPQGQARVPLDYQPSLEQIQLNLTPSDERLWWPQQEEEGEPDEAMMEEGDAQNAGPKQSRPAL
jgi:hypothetical protein